MIRRTLVLSLLVSVAAVAAISPAEYRTRRDNLRKAVQDGIVVLFAGSEHGGREGFFPESNFYYLSGWTYPGAALLLTPDGGDTLLLPKHNPAAEKWTGPLPAPDDAGIAERTGFARVVPMESLEAEIRLAMEKAPKIYTLSADKMKALAPLREVVDAGPQIAPLRMVKSAAEVAEIQRAADVSIEGHRAAWARLAPGRYEYQVAAALTAVTLDSGCGRNAYPPIAGSGPNSTALHYGRNTRRMDSGEVLVLDAAAECGGYAADITRTLPVNGRFTARQREIYDIVLGAQRAAIAAVKPGMLLTVKDAPGSLYKIAYEYINTHGKDKQGLPLGRYFTHGLGHHVGLDVHDAMVPTTPLAENMVITIEPGIYIPEENIGIRIEDMVLVTATGGKVLTSALPTEAEAVERAVGSRKPVK